MLLNVSDIPVMIIIEKLDRDFYVRFRYTFILLSTIGSLTACHHFDPMDTVKQEKPINIAVINSESYRLLPDAHCTITTDSGEPIETKLNPDMILLATNYRTLALECDAPGYKQNAIAITNTINHWAASDLFMLPGDVVDTTSSLLPYYPSHVLVLMSKTPFTFPETIEANYQRAKANNVLYQGTVA